MSPFGQYLLTVVCAATIASIAISITADNGSAGKLVKMIAGLFVVITMIYPLKKLSFASITDIWSDLSVDASAIVEDGADLAKAQRSELIKQKIAAYILDKASMLGLSIEVHVTLSDDEPPIPKSIIIDGDVSPYVKKQLNESIQQELGIAEEQIVWN